MTSSSKPNIRRNTALVAGSLALALMMSEGLTRIYLASHHEETGAPLVAQRERVLGSTAPGPATPAERFGGWEDSLELHPYFGYVFKPGISLPSQNPNGWRTANRLGFQTKHELDVCGGRYCIDHEPDRKKFFVIGIFGGSFAHFMGEFGDHLEDKLENVIPGRKTIVLNLAMGGQAFPQAANIYSYFKDVIDVPVFLDGLNEIWNAVENNRSGFPAEYAKGAHFKVLTEGARQAPDRRLAIERIESLKSKIRYVTEASLGWGFRNSAVAYLAWHALTNSWSSEIQKETLKVEKSFEKNGRFFDVDDSEIVELAAHEWASYHRMVAEVARLQKRPSIHLLQPNPLVKGTKVLTPNEFNLVHTTFIIGPFVAMGYPRLRSEGERLKSEKLVFEDLCDIYKNVKDDIWVDSAHANEKGYDMVLDRVAELIKKQIGPPGFSEF